MNVTAYNDISPKFGTDCFIAPGTQLIGKIILGNNVNIWYNSVLRADVAPISIGDNTNIQDLGMLHVDNNTPLIIGQNVTVGHRSILHACEIGDSCLIGMGATILNGAKIGANSLVAAGALVPPGKEYPPGSFIIGSPAVVKRELSEEEKEKYGNHYKGYVKLAQEYVGTSRL